jgi:hypothetical protein
MFQGTCYNNHMGVLRSGIWSTLRRNIQCCSEPAAEFESLPNTPIFYLIFLKSVIFSVCLSTFPALTTYGVFRSDFKCTDIFIASSAAVPSRHSAQGRSPQSRNPLLSGRFRDGARFARLRGMTKCHIIYFFVCEGSGFASPRAILFHLLKDASLLTY